MTALPGQESYELLESETRRAQRNMDKAVTGVKLKIADDFARRQMDRELAEKNEKASRAARQMMMLSMKARSEQNHKGRDEKIQKIKYTLAKEAQIEQDREMRRLRKEEEETRKRLKELEEKRDEEIRKREIDYKAKREALLRFSMNKEASETEACREYLRVLEGKIMRSDEKQRVIMNEKVGRIHEHNEDVLERKAHVEEKRFQEWMQEQESFLRH